MSTAKRLCVLGIIGILLQLACFIVIRLLSITVLWSATNGKTFLKEGEFFADVFLFEHNYCHVFSQKFVVLSPLPFYCVSLTKVRKTWRYVRWTLQQWKRPERCLVVFIGLCVCGQHSQSFKWQLFNSSLLYLMKSFAWSLLHASLQLSRRESIIGIVWFVFYFDVFEIVLTYSGYSTHPALSHLKN